MVRLFLYVIIVCFSFQVNAQNTTVNPVENTNLILFNPDMGWVYYEVHPFYNAWSRVGKAADMPEVTNITLFTMWAYIERSEGVYDFARMDEAYDYWKGQGRQIQLRVSSEDYGWCSDVGYGCSGMPSYLINNLPSNQKYLRTLSWGPQAWFVDARNTYYQQRLTAFLAALSDHFSEAKGRPVELVDLRGFGYWGEWHSGYPYPDVTARRDGLKKIIDIWTAAFPMNKLALSYSYDPDSPSDYYAGPTNVYDAGSTYAYSGYLNFSVFDYARTKTNITWRRDGCGGAIHSNERKLNLEEFDAGKGPMFSEMVGGETGLGMGVNDAYNDALSIHPNFIQWHDYLKTKYPDIFNNVMRNYGYRLFPNEVIYTASIIGGSKCTITSKWINRGVGRALKDFNLLIKFKDASGNLLGQQDLGLTGSNTWVKNNTYTLLNNFTMPVITPGDYTLCIGLFDSSRGGKMIELPMDNKTTDGFYPIGKITVSNVGDTCKPIELIGIAVSPNQINLSWADKCNVEAENVVERKIPFWPNPQFEELTRLPANSQFYIDSQLVANTGYTYRVKVYQNKDIITTSDEFYLPTLNPNFFDAAYHAGTTQSSTLFGLTSDKVTDGFACGQDGPFTYAHTNTETNPWWEVDLGAVYFVKEIQVWNRSSCCMNWLSNFSVFTSVNPFISKDYIATKNQNGVDNFYQTSIAQRPTTIAVNNSVRYVRIQLSGANYLVLNEVVVIADQTAVGIADNRTTSTLIIYPNPAMDVISIANDQLTVKQIQITDMQGRFVHTSFYENQALISIDISELAKGLYFMKTFTSQKTYVKKLIIK